MYFGGDNSDRGKQLDSLQAFLAGYSLALRYPEHAQEDLATLALLEDFLRVKSGAGRANGIEYLRSSCSSDEVAWDRIWQLIGEFRANVGQGADQEGIYGHHDHDNERNEIDV